PVVLLLRLLALGLAQQHRDQCHREPPTGTLIRKHHCQDQLSEIQPPRVGPTTGATTTATPNTAKAWPRFAGGNASARIDWATGTMPPPPNPCRMRNSNSAFRFGA